MWVILWMICRCVIDGVWKRLRRQMYVVEMSVEIVIVTESENFAKSYQKVF